MDPGYSLREFRDDVTTVIPADAGIHLDKAKWVPDIRCANSGMTGVGANSGMTIFLHSLWVSADRLGLMPVECW